MEFFFIKNWLFLALLSAFTHASSDALIKWKFSHLPAGRMTVLASTSVLPFFVPLIFFVKKDLVITWEFMMVFSLSMILEVAAYFLYIKAIKSSPISLVIPFLTFTPAFMVITGWIILGEKIRLAGIIGILLVVIGAYTLNLSDTREGFFKPILSIFREKGCVYMLLTSFIYSLTTVLSKMSVILSDPMFFISLYQISVGVVIFIIFIFGGENRPKENLKIFFEDTRALIYSWLLNGLLNFIMATTHIISIMLTNAAYMIAVKRTNVIFSVLYGKVLFSETNFLTRLTGSILMILGISIIAVFGE